MTTTTARPGYDIELSAVINSFPPLPPIDWEKVESLREQTNLDMSSISQRAEELGVVIEDKTITGPRGDVILAILSPKERAQNMPAIYWVHGGGMIVGSRYSGMAELELVEWVAKYGIVAISPEYGLAPETPAPGGVEDSYAGLVWTAEHAEELGIDAGRILIYGCSGGGGIAAAVALLARDKGGPALYGQMLICPQLDDRNNSVSARQHAAADGVVSVWPLEYNQYAWDALLGEGHSDREVSIYAAPARATDLSGLPTTFIDAGSAEVFRDESVAYASLLWEGGVQAELHIWRGGYHGFDIIAPTIPVSVATKAARESWLERILSQ